MPRLPDLQRDFAAHLMGAHDAPGDPLPAGLAVYRNAVRANYRNALAASYPVVRALTGVPFFNATVDAFVAARPSVTGDLNVYGDTFGDFLAAYPPAQTLPYLPDIARLEWMQDEALRAADAHGTPEAVLAALGAVAPADLPALRLAVDPSCRFLRSPHPVQRIWRAHQGSDEDLAAVDLAAGPDDLLVRRVGDEVAIERVPAAERTFLAALATEATLSTALDAALAVDAAFDVGAALRARIGDGTLTGLVAG